MLLWDNIIGNVIEYMLQFEKQKTRSGEVVSGLVFMTRLISIVDNMVFFMFILQPSFVLKQRSLVTGYILGAIFLSLPVTVILRRIGFSAWYYVLRTIKMKTGLLNDHELDYKDRKQSELNVIDSFSLILMKFYFCFSYSFVAPVGLLLFVVYIWLYIVVDVANIALGYYKPIPDYSTRIFGKMWSQMANASVRATVYAALYYSGGFYLMIVTYFYWYWYGIYCILPLYLGNFPFKLVGSTRAASNASISSSSGSGIDPFKGFLDLIELVYTGGMNFDLMAAGATVFVIIALGVLSKVEIIIYLLKTFSWNYSGGKIITAPIDMGPYDESFGEYALIEREKEEEISIQV